MSSLPGKEFRKEKSKRRKKYHGESKIDQNKEGSTLIPDSDDEDDKNCA